jgi:hypothetical protein
MSEKAKIDPTALPKVTRIVVAPATEAPIAAVFLGFDRPQPAPAGRSPDLHASQMTMSLAQLRELRQKVDLVIGQIESRSAPKH